MDELVKPYLEVVDDHQAEVVEMAASALLMTWDRRPLPGALRSECRKIVAARSLTFDAVTPDPPPKGERWMTREEIRNAIIDLEAQSELSGIDKIMLAGYRNALLPGSLAPGD